MNDKLVDITIHTQYLKRSYIKNFKKWYVFMFPKQSILYGNEVHILEKLIFVENFYLKLKIPCNFIFSVLKVEKINNSYKTEVFMKIDAELLKEQFKND